MDKEYDKRDRRKGKSVCGKNRQDSIYETKQQDKWPVSPGIRHKFPGEKINAGHRYSDTQEIAGNISGVVRQEYIEQVVEIEFRTKMIPCYAA